MSAPCSRITRPRRTALSAREADALPIPGVGREIDHAHDRGRRVEGKVPAADGELLDPRSGRSAVGFEQLSQLFQSQHGSRVAEAMAQKSRN